MSSEIYAARSESTAMNWKCPTYKCLFETWNYNC